MWPPPPVEPVAVPQVTTPKEIVPITPNYFKDTLRNSTMYSVGLCSVLGKMMNYNSISR